MKKAISFFILSATILILSSCITLTARGDLPPGQEKKITGDKDASGLAPGKNK